MTERSNTPNHAEHPRSLLIIGGGGHAKVVAEAALLAGWRISGFLDDDPAASLGATAERLGALVSIGQRELTRRHPSIIALGDLRLRRDCISRIEGEYATVIHPGAIVAPSATIGPGVFIGPGAIVHTDARIGAHCTVNSGAIVEHDVILGDNAHLAPDAALGGSVHVGSGTLIGLGARVLPGVHIGADAIVGAGAAVIRDTPDGACVVGVPATAIGVPTE
ncbi:MAG: acetyltransferase [Phycisphaeraceae bacterium]|nr:acetyltransferase [Phycisphaeraceae bacterium]MCB9846977.1 acetyltransferase [Phycisphaeraceae bacterium]